MLPQSVCILLGIKFHTFMLLVLLTPIHTLFRQNRYFILRNFLALLFPMFVILG